MTVKIRRHHVITLTHENREFKLTHEPADGFEPIVHILPNNRAVIGYLVQDQDCANPLEDCDGIGKIYDARADPRAYREAIGRTEDDDNDGKANPLEVLLDVYSHGGDVWRVRGGGRHFVDGQWDVSNCAGVWVPDPCCEDHICYMALKKLLPEGTGVEYKINYHDDDTVKAANVITYTLPDGRSRGGYKNFATAIAAATKALGVKIAKAALCEKQREVAVECAERAVETFNEWLSGECFGVVLETYDAAGKSVDEHSCWGHIGASWAEKSLQEAVQCAIQKLTSPDRGADDADNK